jgi:hypothetical protein
VMQPSGRARARSSIFVLSSSYLGSLRTPPWYHVITLPNKLSCSSSTFAHSYQSLHHLEVLPSTWTLDDLWDHLLDIVPIFRVNANHFAVEVLLDCHKRPPALPVMNEADWDTNAAKSSGTTDAVEVSLRIWLVLSVLRNVLSSD